MGTTRIKDAYYIVPFSKTFIISAYTYLNFASCAQLMNKKFPVI